jgi:dTDP-4-amino-4,6-dideoxygalactose transaminase
MAEADRGPGTPAGVASGRVRRLAVPIPLVDLAAQHRALERPLREAIGRVLETSRFILGEEVEAFEREFAAFCGVKHAVGVGSGLDALALSLRALGVGRGAEVLVPANTFIATALAVSAAGGTPVLVDVDPERYTMDPDLAARAVTKKTRALIPVHLYGQSADMEPLRELARRKGIAVVEDACQAHGAALNGARCGAMSDAGCFSFYPTKNLGALGDGGMVVTDRDDVAEQVRRLRDCGRRGKDAHALKGVNSRLDALQASVLRLKLRHLARWNEARRRHAMHYGEALKDLPVATPVEARGATHVYHLYVVRAARRDELMRHLEGVGITCGIHYPVPIHLQEAYADLERPAGSYPVTERLAGEVLSLPMYPEMADSDVDRICAAIAAFYGPPAHGGGA